MNSKVIYGNVTLQHLEHLANGPLLHIGLFQEAIGFENLKNPMIMQDIESKAKQGYTLVYWHPSKFCIRMDRRTGRLQRMPGQKLIVEVMPALNQYWHMYWAFSMIKNQILGFSNSYALEAAYNKYLNGKADSNPFDPNIILSKIAPYAIAIQDKAFDFTINEQIVPIDKTLYRLEKQKIFDNFSGPADAIRRLSKFTKANVPKWYIPKPSHLKILFDNNFKSINIIRSDTPVDEYLTQCLRDFIYFNNFIMKSLYEKI